MNFIAQVNADYKKILEEGDVSGQYKTLTERMVEDEMDMHGEPFPTFLKPYFVDVKDRQYIAKTTEVLIRALEKIGKARMEGGRFTEFIKLKDRWLDLAQVDPVYPSYQVMVRLDVFFNLETKDMKFIEYNCGDPSGMGWHDAMLKIFNALPSIKKLGKKYDLSYDWLLETHHKALQEKYGQWCKAKGLKKKKNPTFAIVCWKDSTIIGDVKQIVEFTENKGFEAYYADPADFAYDGTDLTLRGKKIDIIYRDAITDFIKDEFWPHCQAAIQAYRDGNVCFVNPVRAATGDFKTILEILSDEEYRGLFDDEENETAAKHIPWTRLMRPRKTTFHGETIDLVPFVRENRERFVLKPNDGYGGFGVYVGPITSDEEWRKAVDKAANPAEGKEYALQELVDIPMEEFPEIKDGKLDKFAPKFVNINYWSHAGKFAGAFCRAAAGKVVNVHQGGGLVPVYFVGKKKK